MTHGTQAPETKGLAGQAIIEDGVIVIRVPVASLPQVVSGACDLQAIEPRYEVYDAESFAPELVRELNRDDEVGTTRIHRMFDAAILEAIEQGAPGIAPADEDDSR